MNILQLTHKPPFPAIDGGCLEMAKMSKLFHNNNNCKYYLLTIATDKHPFKKEQFNTELPKARVDHVFLDTKISPFGALNALLKNKSYHLSRFYSPVYIDKLKTILRETSFDYIVVESIFVGQFIDHIRAYSKAKIIYNAPNIEWEIWARLADETKNPLKKWYLHLLSKQLQREEREICQKFDGILALTKKDESVFNNELAPKVKTAHIPYKIDLTNYVISTTQPKDIIKCYHLGAMDWAPNIHGVEWLLDHVWKPAFLDDQKLSLSLAGKDMPEHFFEYAKENIEVTGFIENPLLFIQNKHVLIVPLFSGSGMRIKIIEAMAMGKCVIGTDIAFEGIDVKEGQTALIANNKNEFISQLNKLKENPNLILDIGKAARKLVEEKYNQLTLLEEVNQFFNELK